MKEAALRSSEREKIADEAERDVDDIKKAEYAGTIIGGEFDGIVSGVTSFGIFVELENTAEGLIRIETLKGGWYEFDEKNFVLKNKSKSYRLGQAIRIRVDGVDAISRKAEFSEV